MRVLLQGLVLVCLALLMGIAQAGGRAQRRALEVIQSTYAAAIRWNDFDAAEEYIDPVYRQQHRQSDLQRSRYSQVQISGYRVLRAAEEADGAVRQDVELGVVSRNTQVERIVHSTEIWRWDEGSKRWWLTSGLPDLWQDP